MKTLNLQNPYTKSKALRKIGQVLHINVINVVKVSETYYVHVKKHNLIVIILRLTILIVNNIYHVYKWEGSTVFIFIL